MRGMVEISNEKTDEGRKREKSRECLVTFSRKTHRAENRAKKRRQTRLDNHGKEEQTRKMGKPNKSGEKSGKDGKKRERYILFFTPIKNIKKRQMKTIRLSFIITDFNKPLSDCLQIIYSRENNLLWQFFTCEN